MNICNQITSTLAGFRERRSEWEDPKKLSKKKTEETRVEEFVVHLYKIIINVDNKIFLREDAAEQCDRIKDCSSTHFDKLMIVDYLQHSERCATIERWSQEFQASEDALSVVYAIFLEWGLKRGWCSTTSRTYWTEQRRFIFEIFEFANSNTYSYQHIILIKTAVSNEMFTRIAEQEGGTKAARIVYRPLFPQACNLLVHNLSPLPDGIRMRAFLLICHLANVHIGYWIETELERSCSFQPTGEWIIMLHKGGSTGFSVPVHIASGSEACEAFTHFFEIRKKIPPLHWRSDTLFGFKNTQDVRMQLHSIQEATGFPERYFHIRSIHNAAVATYVCKSMLEEGVSKGRAIERLKCRPGYKWDVSKLKRILDVLPDRMLSYREEGKLKKFSEIPLAGNYGLYDELKGFSFSEGPIYKRFHSRSSARKAIESELYRLFSSLEQRCGIQDIVFASNEDVLGKISTMLFSQDCEKTYLILDDIVQAIVACKVDNNVIEIKKMVIFCLVSGGFLCHSNWRDIKIPNYIRTSFSRMKRNAPHQIEPKSFTYNMVDKDLKGKEDLRAHLIAKRAGRGPHQLEPLINGRTIEQAIYDEKKAKSRGGDSRSNDSFITRRHRSTQSKSRRSSKKKGNSKHRTNHHCS